ncbi:MAG: Gfo/Idh/MocA family oxidoreductase [Armatimonadota bacterium]|nr:Gfo/Idh/MocA family oxidoreductase [Armatimonadota bacterium]
MSEPVPVAFIGAGSHANYAHYPSLSEMEDVRIVAVCDLNPERAAATAQRWNIPRTYTDYRQMLQETQPQAVYVILPPHLMFDIVVDCLNRKLHVFMEKPPGITLGQTQNLARLAERNGCLTMVGFQRRFVPLVVQARRRVEERGAITQCLARFVKSGGTEDYYGGAVDILTCDAIHAVDTLRWMGGEVKKIVSKVDRFHAPVDNAFNALVEFESGAAGILLTNWVTGRRIFSVEMHAFNISAYAEPDDRALIYRDGSLEPEIILNTEAAGSSAPHRYLGFYDENRHFIDCLKSGQQPQTCFADAVKTMELVERIRHERL